MSPINESNQLLLVKPDFDDRLTDILMELNHLRKQRLGGTTHPALFFQIRHLFHVLESVGSARIEGNHTTVPEYIEQKSENASSRSEAFSEIRNVEEAITYIEQQISSGTDITNHFIKELHQLTVKNLNREGDDNAGGYREKDVWISQSDHVPPSHLHVNSLMDELVAFINSGHPEKYDLLKIAIAHHRFTWIHPFGNGNGRVVRLLTYALLIKYGFNVKEGKLINPTAVFCNDRDKYYEMLSTADKGDDSSMLEWCEYVLAGFLNEVTKINNLLDFDYLSQEILLPTLEHGKTRGILNDEELKVLKLGLSKQIFTAQDLQPAFAKLNTHQKAHKIKKLREAELINNLPEQPRTYYVNFTNKVLFRSILFQLKQKGIIDFTA